MQAELTYFKESGKYYTDGNLQILPEEINDEGNLCLMFKLVDRVKELSTNKELPGVGGNWLKEGHILIDVPEIGYPHLILKR